MLIDDLYTIQSNSADAGSSQYRFELQINRGHEIFKGHFPGQPVLPGVCQIEMVKELVEASLGRKVRLNQASNIKYIEIVNPNEHDEVVMEINIQERDYGLFVKAASLFRDGRANFKFAGTFV